MHRQHVRSRAHLVFAAMLGLILPASSCMTPTPTQKDAWDRLFPANPEDVFVDDAARDIDRRLSKSSSAMGL